MAENKKSFLLYADLIHTVKKMPKEKAGELLLTILSYVNDENPVVDDILVDLVFEPIKHQLKRDLQRYEGIKAKRAENGRAGGLKSGEVRKQTEANEANASINEANEADNVTVNDTDTVNDNEIESNTVTPADLSKSNLFRQPVIPTKAQVWEVFARHNGTKEMAKKFFNNNSAVGWFSRGSPIVNFANLVPGFISSWQSIEPKEVNNGLKI